MRLLQITDLRQGQQLYLGGQKNQKNQLLLKEDTSDYFLKLLRSVVTKTTFTGPRVKIEGYNIGGKTGTAMLTNAKWRILYR